MNNFFDVIVVGGSYSGLAAAMALGRALKTVLVIDSGLPCNRQTPHSHNFLTRDGSSPKEIAANARKQVRQYDTVTFLDDAAIDGNETGNGFEILTASGQAFFGVKLIFATGVRDILPDIEGLSACWGITALHCPYCHGYEVRSERTGIIGNGEQGFELARLIFNWTEDLTLFTNGISTLTNGQELQLRHRSIRIVKKEIEYFEHSNGLVQNIVFKDRSKESVKAIYLRPPFEQHSRIPETMGCGLTEDGYLKIDAFHETTIPGIYAVGDNASRMRTVANAVSMGTAAGITISRKMIFEQF
ncbi:MAG TPA: NAD(P)/FAD-dependent oxidoreductase [Puia sp.]|jgi:thioredoxin reductase|nr:NAD(P)/FAD-dependent oxidoreductase [Puia sp.]HVV03986.1 NAD(P)/FAD-dependent oxidoreductase [Puia sp.]